MKELYLFMLGHRVGDQIYRVARYRRLAVKYGSHTLQDPRKLAWTLSNAFVGWRYHHRRPVRVCCDGDQCCVDIDLRSKEYGPELTFIFRPLGSGPPLARPVCFRRSSDRVFVFGRGSEGYSPVGSLLEIFR